jgi:hypothetical protein
VTAVVFFLTAVAPLDSWGQADPKKEQAKQFFETGKRFYEMQNWRAAIDQFKQAAAILPSPILDYNIAICYEKLGKPRPAVKYYQRYLQQLPKADNRAEVEAKIAALEAQVAAIPAPAPAPAPAPTPGPTPAPGPAPAPPPAAPGAANDDYVPPVGEMPAGGYWDYGYGGKATPTTGSAVKPITHQWWFWVLIAVGVAAVLGAAIYLTTHGSDSSTGIEYTSAGPRLKLQPGTPSMRPMQHRPLLAPPPNPAGVLFRF